jgi:hypothetical protein
MSYTPLTIVEKIGLGMAHQKSRYEIDIDALVGEIEVAVLARIAQAEQHDGCWCESCDVAKNIFVTRMALCPRCGDKRCPRSSHHDSACAASPVSPTEAPKPARSDPVSLHSAIMNLPLKPYDDNTTYYAYSRGHQDARHAAADLVDAHPQQADRELLERVLKALECASNGLLWYADMAPEHVGQSDGEVAEQIDSAITAIRLHLEKP